ncbi:uncharacterized protein LOC128157677 [Crassostrea angulata]|uniref:uncharacterized protein LOC128157677 n=1 Tax=Magallana angulata TaxID=2784310 RepID=UPI0022B1380F|nr:uncharacterized protein LOC128157677 [Crassostrea angulata]
MRNIFIKLFLLILCDITAWILITKDVELLPSTVLKIKSPGYPDVNYKNNRVLIWNVTAPASTEEISIDIEIDIVKPPNGLCEDYLQIQEINPSSGKFTVFNQCGKLTANRITKGNHLLIKFVSNFDLLTSKGFQIQLRVLKERSTTSMLTTRKSSMSTIASIISTTTTTTLPNTTEMKSNEKIVSRIISPSKFLTKILTKATHLKSKTTTIASTTKATYRKTKPPKISTVTTPNSLPPSSKTTYSYAASLSTVGIPVSHRKRSSLGLTTTLAATNEISTSRSFVSEQITTQTRPYQPT